MFEEGQLYSPVTADGDGEVTVHLADDHPGAGDPDYRRRRSEIAALALAWRAGDPAPPVRYTDAEQEVWRTVARELEPKHERLAIREFIDAKHVLDLPTGEVPSLDLVSERLAPVTGFCYLPAAGLVPLREFYGSLSERLFHSTQYVRHPAVPLYTPEPDIIHEVVGHGHLLATPTFSRLHHLTGQATHRLRDEENLRFLSRVFWFTVEFGVVVEDGELRAYGAGILSSYGESTSSATWISAPSTSSRWAPPTTTSPTTSRSSTAPSRSTRCASWWAASSAPAVTSRSPRCAPARPRYRPRRGGPTVPS